MNRRSFLTFLGLTPAPITMTFHKASSEIAEKMGCTGFLATNNSLTAAQVEIIKERWARDGEKITLLALGHIL